MDEGLNEPASTFSGVDHTQFSVRLVWLMCEISEPQQSLHEKLLMGFGVFLWLMQKLFSELGLCTRKPHYTVSSLENY